MFKNSRFLLLVGTVVLASTLVYASTATKKHHEIKKMDKKDVVMFIEGVIEGVIEEEKFTDLQDCIQNTVDLEDQVVRGINDLETETFEGVRQGLEELGKAIKLIPTLVSTCKESEIDLTKLIKAAEIFEHPRDLMYKATKNLVINGVEIYTQLSGAISSYKKNQFYAFGYHLGLGIDELVLKGALRVGEVKSESDIIAYKFLTGFAIPLKAIKHDDLKLQRFFNTIRDGDRAMRPVVALMKELEKTKESHISLKAWMQLHELVKCFRQHEDMFVTKKILTPKEFEAIREIVEVLDNASLNFKRFSKDPRIISLFQNAYQMFEAKQWKTVGQALGFVAVEIRNMERSHNPPREYERKIRESVELEEEDLPFYQ